MMGFCEAGLHVRKVFSALGQPNSMVMLLEFNLKFSPQETTVEWTSSDDWKSLNGEGDETEEEAGTVHVREVCVRVGGGEEEMYV